MSKPKPKKEKLTIERKIEIAIEALIAIAALIDAIRWW